MAALNFPASPSEGDLWPVVNPRWRANANARWRLIAGAGGGDSGGSNREILSTSRTYYVRSDGSDTNNGLEDTSGGAFLTLQGAVAAVGKLDMNNDPAAIVDIWMQPGATFTGATDFGPLINPAPYASGLFDPHSYFGVRSVLVHSDPLNKATLQAGVGDHHVLQFAGVNALWCFDNLVIDMATHGGTFDQAFRIRAGAWVETNSLDFLLAGQQRAYSADNYCRLAAPYTGCNVSITGDFGAFIEASGFTNVDYELETLTLNGAPAMSEAFVFSADHAELIIYYDTLVGTATGRRFWVLNQSIINLFGAGETVLPGDVAGTEDTASYGLLL